jgi:hypothetical protein
MDSVKSVVSEKLGWNGCVVDKLKPEELCFVLAMIAKHDIIERKLHETGEVEEKKGQGHGNTR